MQINALDVNQALLFMPTRTTVYSCCHYKSKVLTIIIMFVTSHVQVIICSSRACVCASKHFDDKFCHMLFHDRRKLQAVCMVYNFTTVLKELFYDDVRCMMCIYILADRLFFADNIMAN